ncbi:unnamed protein product [Orchesella dallaii]|uniref:Uncharacterized protein n=1 Tax=Orchesella dallaii TaxID=48710 RepID=A0ABP1RNU8_9HEXA
MDVMMDLVFLMRLYFRGAYSVFGTWLDILNSGKCSYEMQVLRVCAIDKNGCPVKFVGLYIPRQLSEQVVRRLADHFKSYLRTENSSPMSNTDSSSSEDEVDEDEDEFSKYKENNVVRMPKQSIGRHYLSNMSDITKSINDNYLEFKTDLKQHVSKKRKRIDTKQNSSLSKNRTKFIDKQVELVSLENEVKTARNTEDASFLSLSSSSSSSSSTTSSSSSSSDLSDSSGSEDSDDESSAVGEYCYKALQEK